MDGKRFVIMLRDNIYFCGGIDVYNGTVYWSQVQTSALHAIFAKDKAGPQRTMMMSHTLHSVHAIKVVHPLKQRLPDGRFSYYFNFLVHIVFLQNSVPLPFRHPFAENRYNYL